MGWSLPWEGTKGRRKEDYRGELCRRTCGGGGHATTDVLLGGAATETWGGGGISVSARHQVAALMGGGDRGTGRKRMLRRRIGPRREVGGD